MRLTPMLEYDDDLNDRGFGFVYCIGLVRKMLYFGCK
jgi:hypothetical protein